MAQIIAGGTKPDSGGNVEVITQTQTTTWAQLQGKPYILVSSKGIVNGLSNIPNDGADFGPDTTLGATAPGQYGGTYTETSGIQESHNYIPSGHEIRMCEGNYKCTQTIIISKNIVFSGVPSGTYGLGPMSTATDEVSLFPVNIISGGNQATVSLNFSGGTSTASVDGFVYFYGITFTGSGNKTYTSEVAIAPSSTANQNINVQFNNSRITLYYTCVIVGSSSNNIYVEFASTHSLFDSYLYNALTCNYGELYLLYDHINNAAATSNYVSGGSGILVDDTFQKGMVDSCIVESIGDCLHFLGSKGHFEIIGGHWYNNLNGYVFHISGDSGEILYIGMLSIYAGANDSFYFDSGSAVNNITVNTVYMGGSGSIAFTSTTTIGSNFRFLNVYPTSKITPTLATNPPVSGTAYQNTNPYDIRLKIPVTYSPTSSAAATLATGTSSSSTVTTSTKVSYPAGITTGIINTYEMVVPAGQYFELVVTNATIGTVEVQVA